MIVIRCYYQTGASNVCMTVVAARSAPGAGTPSLNFRGALTALRNRNSARVQLRQKTTRGLFKSLSAFRVCVAHDEQHRRKGIGNAGIQVGEFRNV
jgi:hypothetical protein